MPEVHQPTRAEKLRLARLFRVGGLMRQAAYVGRRSTAAELDGG